MCIKLIFWCACYFRWEYYRWELTSSWSCGDWPSLATRERGLWKTKKNYFGDPFLSFTDRIPDTSKSGLLSPTQALLVKRPQWLVDKNTDFIIIYPVPQWFIVNTQISGPSLIPKMWREMRWLMGTWKFIHCVWYARLLPHVSSLTPNNNS